MAKACDDLFAVVGAAIAYDPDFKIREGLPDHCGDGALQRVAAVVGGDDDRHPGR